MMSETFHFLRPDWLWGLLGLPLLWLWARRRDRAAGGWRKACDPALLPHLLHQESAGSGRWPLAALVMGWLGATLALAGPTWERLPETSYHEPTQTVAVLQLTSSMRARDIAPSRLDRARYELQDLLDQAEGTVGLVIFAEEAYSVTPLTDDPRVIQEIVPTLDPNLMPGRGTRVDRAVAEAHQLLENAGARSGRIVLLVDGLGDSPERALMAAEQAAEAGYPVSVLSLSGEPDTLRPLAEAGHGRFTPVLPDDRDVALLLSLGAAGPEDFGALRESGVQADTWRDAGTLLLWIPLLLAPLAFRRGWAGSLGLLLLFSVSTPQPAQARTEDWFSRPDQQAAAAFEDGQHQEAAARFENSEWRGVAAYRSGQHQEAAKILSEIDSPRARYNLGNALAQSGQLEEAIAAYDDVIEEDENHEDALFNRELVARLLEQQEQQQEQEQQESSESGQGQDDASQDESGGSEASESEPADSGENGSENSSGSEGSPESAKTQSKKSEAGTSEGDSADSSQNAPEPGNESGTPPEASETASSSPQSASADAGSMQDRQPPEGDRSPDLGRSRQEKEENAGRPEGASSDPSSARQQAETEPESPGAAEPEAPEGEKAGPAVAASGRTPMSEQDQEIEQWLSRVPDDPGGLLREKLRRRYAEKRNLGGWR